MLKKIDILIAGQLVTSRTETLEDYLRRRARALAVIGLMSPFATRNQSRCTLYAGAHKIREIALPSFRITRVTPWNRPLIVASAAFYILSFFLSAIFLRRRFDIFIGIATFSAFMGLILKHLGLVNRVIYYCLDYYPPWRPFVQYAKPADGLFKSPDAIKDFSFHGPSMAHWQCFI